MDLTPGDLHGLRAVEGWLELGNQLEAAAELDRLSPELQAHPEVLKLRWIVLSQAKNWEACVEVAREIIRVADQDSFGWIHLAYATRRSPQGGLREAWDILLPAAEKFPKEWMVPYNLACYACQLGHLPEAETWLYRAVKVSSKSDEIRAKALADPDLEPIWAKIR